MTEPGAVIIEATLEAEFSAENPNPEKPRLPRFSMVAYTGGPMRIAGWRYPVVVDLAGLAIPSQNRPIRFGHDMQSGVGHTDAIRIEDGQLLAAGVVSRDTPAAKEIVVFRQERFSLAGIDRRQRRGVRVRQGRPKGPGQRPASSSGR